MTYPTPEGLYDTDDETMQRNVSHFANEIVGRRILSVNRAEYSLTLTLDNGNVVQLVETSDCCAYTELEDVIEHLPTIEHVITRVEVEKDYYTWHIFADLGEVLELKVAWSEGSGYYGYGFDIQVREASL